MKRYFFIIFFLFAILDKVIGQSFYYVEIENNQPIVVINDENILSRFNRFFINSLLNDNARIKITSEFSKNIDHPWFKGTRYKIICDNRNLRTILSHVIDDVVNIQRVDKDGNGEIVCANIDSIFYEITDYRNSHITSKILYYCCPCTDYFEKGKENNNNLYIATSYDEYRPEYSTISIPDKVESIIDSLVTIILTDEIDKNYSSITKTPLVINHNIYYIALISYGEKGHIGYLYILSGSGDILSENVGRYNYIIGKTDVDTNKEQELIIFYGDSYGGGIEVFTIDDRNKESIKLVSCLRYTTVID